MPKKKPTPTSNKCRPCNGRGQIYAQTATKSGEVKYQWVKCPYCNGTGTA